MIESEPQFGAEVEESKTTGESAEPENELDKLQREGQVMIDSYRRFFASFASDNSLSFRLANAFRIDFDKGEIEMDTGWFAEKEATPSQIVWACLHELSHFRDLAADPEGIKGGFEHIRAEARQTGAVMMKKWEEAFGASNPELIEKLKTQRPVDPKNPSETMNAVESAAYQFHHTFYNIFDDIYVNGLIEYRAPRYEMGTPAGDEVSVLYRDKLFAQTDYTDLPRHLQFLYKLIREKMVPGEKVAVSAEVEAELEKSIKFLGRDFLPRDLIEQFLRPKGNRDTRARERYFVLQKTLEPIFRELLMKDLEEWQPQEPQEQEGGQRSEGKGEPEKGESGEPQINTNPWQDEYQEFKENSPDQISEEEMDDWREQEEQKKAEVESQEKEEAEEDKKSAGQKAQEAQGRMDEKWCEKNQISPESLRRFRQIQAEIEPHLAELSRLWRKIIFGSSKIRERALEGHFKTGTELDVGRVIEEWPRISRDQAGQAEVMKKMAVRETLVRQPELIRVRLIGDRSGSMDEGKSHVLEQCFVLILSSLREFNNYLNLTRSQTKSKLETDTEAWIFGDSAERIKKSRGTGSFEAEQAEIVRVFEGLQKSLGETYDHTALEQVRSSITPEEKGQIAKKKIMEIVFEITDGGSSSPESARRAVDGLISDGVVVRAFQIGSVYDAEKELFNQVWNEERTEELGEVVGSEIGNLLPAVTRALKRYLQGVRL